MSARIIFARLPTYLSTYLPWYFLGRLVSFKMKIEFEVAPIPGNGQPSRPLSWKTKNIFDGLVAEKTKLIVSFV